VAAQLEAAQERFKEYERKDVKLREDVRHLSARAQKLAAKLARDAAKAQVGHPLPPAAAAAAMAPD
jgi:structural maintenance of chromosome 4